MNSAQTPAGLLATASAAAQRFDARRAASAVFAVVVFALATAAAAQVKFYLPNTPVPVTLQTLVVVLSGVALGPWLGAASMALYLSLGFAGLPVFTTPPDYGFARMFSATGGYLVAFLAAPPVAAIVAGRNPRHWLRVAGSMLLGHLVIFAIGVPWLLVVTAGDLAALGSPGAWQLAIAQGFTPFVAGTLLKSLAGVLLAIGLLRAVRPRSPF